MVHIDAPVQKQSPPPYAEISVGDGGFFVFSWQAHSCPRAHAMVRAHLAKLALRQQRLARRAEIQ
jgi:hypothetical protein